MPNPKSVKFSQTFVLDRVIYNQNGFSIAIGKYYTNNMSWILAMRYNGYEKRPGFPYAGKNSLWFTIPEEFTFNFLTALLLNDNLTQEGYNQIIKYLKDFKITKRTKSEIEESDKMFDKLFGNLE